MADEPSALGPEEQQLLHAARADLRALDRREPLSFSAKARHQRALRRLRRGAGLTAVSLALPSLAAAALAGGVALWGRPSPTAHPPLPVSAAPSPAPFSALPAAAPTPPEEPPAPHPAVVPPTSPAPASAAPTARRSRPTPRAGPAPTAPAEPPSAPIELDEVAQAIQRLDRNRDLPGALAAVARYRRDYPRGRLHSAVDVVEVQAEAALHGPAAALDALGRLRAAGPLTAELQLREAQLLENAGDARAAAAAWGRVLAGSPQAALREEAVCRRGLLRTRLGQGSAYDDLEECLAGDPPANLSADLHAALRTLEK